MRRTGRTPIDTDAENDGIRPLEACVPLYTEGNSKVEYNPQSVACGAALVRLMYELMLADAGWEKLYQALHIEKRLELAHLTGKEKGLKVREIRDTLIKEFGSYSAIPPQILKGKNIKRIFWAVADIDNLDEMERVLMS